MLNLSGENMSACSVADKGNPAGDMACQNQRWYSSSSALLRGGPAIAGSTNFAIKLGRLLRDATTIFEVRSRSRGSPEIAEVSTSICSSAGLLTNSKPKSVASSSPEALEEN